MTELQNQILSCQNLPDALKVAILKGMAEAEERALNFETQVSQLSQIVNGSIRTSENGVLRIPVGVFTQPVQVISVATVGEVVEVKLKPE